MSKCTVYHTPRNQSITGIKNVVLLGPYLMAASLEQAGQLVRLASNMLSDLPSVKHSGCCDIPEADCPPRCACTIQWEASPGEHLNSSIRVTNTSCQHARNFQFSATPFQGAGNPQVALAVSPANANLQPGQSILINAAFTPNQTFQVGQTYRAEVLIKGAYEQCVCFEFTPTREVKAECGVEQGDPPIRLRRHQWYDHFQCAEPCFSTTKR